MTFLANILRYLFWLLVVSWSAALLRRLVQRMGREVGRSQPYVDVPGDELGRKLVRDPVCGLHVCSAACRDKYIKESRKLAANA